MYFPFRYPCVVLADVFFSRACCIQNLKPYHSSKYELADLSDSFEARMLETLRQQALDGTSDSSDDGGGGGTARRGVASPSRYKYATDIASNSSDDDTSVGAAQRMVSRRHDRGQGRGIKKFDNCF